MVLAGLPLTHQMPMFVRYWRVVRLAVPAVLIAVAIRGMWTTYSQWGLFLGVGYDYGLYQAQVAALWSGDPTAIYRPDVLDHYHQLLAVYTSAPQERLPSGAVPYPPVFAWLFTPFTVPNPPIGFAVWTAVNLVALVALAWRLARFFPPGDRLWVGLLFAASPAVWTTLYLGQPMILLAWVVTEAYIALRSGRDLRAGLWIAALVFKPQYAVLIGLLMLWKRRWKTVAGAGVGVAIVLLASILVAGLPALLAYPASLADYTGFRGSAGTLDLPELMINWRSLVLVLMPGLGTRSGLALTLALSLATIVAVAVAWRGPWSPDDRSFPVRATVLLLATLLANYHSHQYGMLLLAAPVASLMAHGSLRPASRLTVLACIALVIVVIPTLELAHDAQLYALVLVVCLAALLADVVSTPYGRLPPAARDLKVG